MPDSKSPSISGLDKPVEAAILSFFVPGLGQRHIKSPLALTYFVGAVAFWVIGGILGVVTCGLGLFLPLAFHLVSAYDAYSEASGKPRILKDYIK